MQFNLPLFIHLAGLIIGLGAVTVIDVLGFRSRNSKELTKVTIYAHYTTKPLIWIGIALIVASLPFLQVNQFTIYKWLLLIIMLANGSFLSFHISPILSKHLKKNTTLPRPLQHKISLSFYISFLSWWTFVALTALLI